MAEPFQTYLMPIYAALSWIALCYCGNRGPHLLPVALVGWAWAGINIVRNGQFDLGIVTFGIVAVLASLERFYFRGLTPKLKLGLTAACLFVAINYSLVVILWKDLRPELAESRSNTWLAIFWGYCLCMMVYWVAAAVLNQRRRGEIMNDVDSVPDRPNEDEDAHISPLE